MLLKQSQIPHSNTHIEVVECLPERRHLNAETFAVLQTNEFFSEMEAARIQGTYDEVMRKLSKIPLIVFDNFLLLPTTQIEQTNLLILFAFTR